MDKIHASKSNNISVQGKEMIIEKLVEEVFILWEEATQALAGYLLTSVNKKQRRAMRLKHYGDWPAFLISK